MPTLTMHKTKCPAKADITVSVQLTKKQYLQLSKDAERAGLTLPQLLVRSTEESGYAFGTKVGGTD